MKSFIICLFFIIPSTAMFAQTAEELVEWFHKGQTAFEQEDYQDAILYLEKIYAIYETGQIQTTKEYGYILHMLAESNDQLGNYTKAVEYEKKAVECFKSTTGENHPDYATCLQNLANYLFDNKEYSQSVEWGIKAMEKRKEILGESHPDYAQSLYNLVSFYSSLGDYIKAVEYGSKALALYVNISAEDSTLYISLLETLANCHNELNNYSKAIELKEIALHPILKEYGEKSFQYVGSLQRVADYYSTPVGNQVKAIEYETKIMDIIKTIAGEDNYLYSLSLNHQASYYNKLGDYSKAIEIGLHSAFIAAKTMGEENPGYATSLNNVACYYSNKNDDAKAVEYATKAMIKRKTASGDKKIDHAAALEMLASFQFDQEHYEKAIDYLRISSNIYKDVLGERSNDFAASLNNLALCYSQLGNYSKAVELGKQSIELSTFIHDKNDSVYATQLDNLANYYYKLGDYANAVQYKEKVVSILKETGGEYSSDYGIALRNLADYYSYLGDYPKAIEYGLMGERIIKETQGEYHHDYATSLSNLALYYHLIGDNQKAVEYGNKSVHLYQEVIGGNYYGYSASLNNLSIYYHVLGDYQKALEYALKAEKTYKARFGEDHHDYAALSANLARCYEHNDYNMAIEYATKAMSIIGENDYYYPSCLILMADCYSGSGNNEKAIEYGIKAINHRKTKLGENHLDNAGLYESLASYYSELSDYSKSIECIQQSTSVTQFNTLLFFQNLSSNLRYSFWGQNSFQFTDRYPSLYYRVPTKSATDLYDKSALFAKGILLSTEIEIKHLIHENGDDEAIKMFDELSRQKLRLQKLYEKPLTERHLNTDSLTQEIERLERKLVARSKVYGDFTKKLRTTWQDVQKALDNDEIAIEFLSFNLYGTDSTMIAALTLRKDDIEPRFIPLFELRQLQGVSDTIHFICPEVSNLLWKPLYNELRGIRRVYFSPSGVLHKIAVEYAPGMECYELYRLSTTRELIDMKESSTQTEEVGTTTLYGGIDYETLETPPSESPASTQSHQPQMPFLREISNSRRHAFIDSLNLRGIKVDYLPGTLTEVKSIQASLEGIHKPVKVHVGFDASEKSVKLLSGNAPDILHIATHGFYFTEEQAIMNNNRLFLTNLNNRSSSIEDKALTRSGVFMAGANKTLRNEISSIDENDGILTAQEISKLNLRGTDLVVLSACETGNGDIMQGEGVLGLQRAFKKAGAKTILMSLDKVDDEATRILMVEFYRNLMNGKTKHKSLQDAQNYLRKVENGKYNDPKYWATFIMLDGLN